MHITCFVYYITMHPIFFNVHTVDRATVLYTKVGKLREKVGIHSYTNNDIIKTLYA